MQTVAASAVADALLDIAEGEPRGRATDVAGPDKANLVNLARAFIQRQGQAIDVQADTQSTAAMPEDAMLPGPDARIIGPSFAEWLDSADAAALGAIRT